ncbi:MAG TPA: flagellar hook-basal body complex protein FliE [Azonexus sp.]|jgi:flagellar hook-basal body complex protein FliE|nr:flagellar hook-basal body complex protein FliE [Azonexus sp.]
MDTSAIDNLLGQLRATAASVSGTAASKAAAPAPGAPDFATVLKNSLDEVSGSQVDAMQRARDFELGVPDSSLNEVMISMQKANLSFQQMVQVRNRLVSAYHDIMNMQV